MAEQTTRLRLFVAVSAPPDRVAHVAELVGPLKPRFPGARWTAPENQHVTLKFLGWTDAAALGAIQTACSGIAASHSSEGLELGDLGAFPSRKRVRVLWVGLDDPAGLLSALARDLDTGLAPLGFEVEKRAFTAHLTLARMKTPLRVTGDWPELHFDPMPWRCAEMTLYRSHLSPTGARYEALATFPLGVDAERP